MPAAPEVNPTVARRELASILRQAREQHRRSVHDVAVRLKVSNAQASKLDSGTRGYPADHVRILADWYDLEPTRLDRLLALAAESRRRAWWQQVDLDPAYRSLIGMEQAATSIYEFAGAILPGLLQTADYARVAAASGDPDASAERIEEAVAIRMRRQEILSRQDRPVFRAVIDEVALARGPRKPSVRRAQLEHLYNLAEEPRITIQIIAFDYGLHVGGNKHFILIDGSGDLPGFGYSEGPIAPAEHTSESDLVHYRSLWLDLLGVARDPASSRRIIARYRDAASPPAP